MRLLLQVIGVLLAIFAILLIADRCFRFSRRYTRRYIEISRREPR